MGNVAGSGDRASLTRFEQHQTQVPWPNNQRHLASPLIRDSSPKDKAQILVSKHCRSTKIVATGLASARATPKQRPNLRHRPPRLS